MYLLHYNSVQQIRDKATASTSRIIIIVTILPTNQLSKYTSSFTFKERIFFWYYSKLYSFRYCTSWELFLMAIDGNWMLLACKRMLNRA